MRSHSALLFILFFFASPLFAIVHEIDSFINISDVSTKSGEEQLILLDVDYVITVPMSHVLRPCGQHYITHFLNRFNHNEGLKNQIINGLLKTRKDVLVEPYFTEWVKKSASGKNHILAITSFPVSESVPDVANEKVRYDQLASLGIDFKAYALAANKKCDKFDLYNGILFAKNGQKGEALSQFLQHIKIAPQRIVFIDDRLDNLQDVERFCAIRGIPFVGYWYHGAEKLPCQLEKIIYQSQFNYLEKYHIWLEEDDIRS